MLQSKINLNNYSLFFSEFVVTKSLVICFVILLGTVNNVIADVITVAFSSKKPPYSFKSKMKMDIGIEVELVRAVLAEMGHSLEIVIMPARRLKWSVQNGLSQASASVQADSSDGLYYSDDFIKYSNVAISKKKLKLEIKNIADLEKYNFIIWKNGWAELGKEFYDTYKPNESGEFMPNYKEAPNQYSQNIIFWRDRLEVIIIDKFIFEYYRETLAKELQLNTDTEVTIHNIFKSEKTVFAIAFQNEKLRDEFNIKLAKIQQEGTYARIVAGFMGSDKSWQLESMNKTKPDVIKQK